MWTEPVGREPAWAHRRWMACCRTLACVASLLMLGGCATELDTADDSVDYLQLRDDPSTGAARTVPAACTGADNIAGRARLPLGCANAVNLQRMVQDTRDLHQGQAMGPTLAAPVGRAAQQYLLGETADLERRRELERERLAAPAP